MSPPSRRLAAARPRARAWILLGIIYCLAALCRVPGAGVDGDYVVDVWTAEKGLPNSSVTSIAQTPDGYLWVGTYNGLARFDGVRFVNFDPQHTPELKHARVRKLCVDSQGTLWINTYDGSLTTWRRGRFEHAWQGEGGGDAQAALVSPGPREIVFLLYNSGALLRRPLSATGTNAWQVLHAPGSSSGAMALQDGEGVVWYCGRDRRLWRLRGDQFELVPGAAGSEAKQINCLVKDKDGRVWIGTEKGISLWDGARFRDQSPTNAPATNVGFLFVDREGGQWIVVDGRLRQCAHRRMESDLEQWPGVLSGSLTRFGAHEDRQGGVWFYDYGKGLLHAPQDEAARQITQADGFPGDRVDSFFEDHEGNLWAGVDRGGLARLRQRRFQVLSAGEGPAPKAAVSVCEDAQGALWIGTFGGGLYQWRDGQFTNYALADQQSRDFVFSVYPGTNGLWISAGDEDLFAGRPGSFQRVTPLVHGVKAILADRQGRVWIGTKSGLYSGQAAAPHNVQAEEGVRRTDVRALAEDKRGAIWAGAGDGTLYRVLDREVTAFHATDNLSQHAIWSLLASDDGTIWLGTFRGGLVRFKDGVFIRFTTKDGLPDDVICQILEDDQGQLWIGSHQGIFRVAKTDLDAFAGGQSKSVPCTAYGLYDGLPALECSGGYQPAAWRGRDGRLWFATLKGVVAVQRRVTTPNRVPPPVVIEELLVDGERMEAGELSAAESGGGLQITSGKRQFDFRFTGLSFISPDRVRFRYKLQGLDGDWVEAGTRRSAQYSFLRAGEYRFRVTACNNEGVWNETGAALTLKILPRYWETWWFVTGMGLVIAGTVAWLAHYGVTRRLRREMEQLEQQRAVERDRTRIAKDIHDDLGAGLTQITLLSELARHDPPQEVETHLAQISETARELTRAMDEIVWAVNPQNDTLDSLVTYVCKFAQEYLSVAGIRCRLDLPARLPPYPLPAEARHNLFLSVKEVLNNVVKHARASEVSLRLAVEASSFTLSIEDNGQGFAVGESAPAPANSTRISSGYGLGNLDKRLAAIGGRCAVTSAPGQGTRVAFTVRFEPGASPVLATRPEAAPAGE